MAVMLKIICRETKGKDRENRWEVIITIQAGDYNDFGKSGSSERKGGRILDFYYMIKVETRGSPYKLVSMCVRKTTANTLAGTVRRMESTSLETESYR